jgi:hypothetical protein
MLGRTTHVRLNTSRYTIPLGNASMQREYEAEPQQKRFKVTWAPREHRYDRQMEFSR